MGRVALVCGIASTAVVGLGVLALWPACRPDIEAFANHPSSDGLYELRSCARKLESQARQWSEERFGNVIRSAVWLAGVVCPLVVHVAHALYEAADVVYSWSAALLRACVPLLARAAVAMADARPIEAVHLFASKVARFLEVTSTSLVERAEVVSALSGAVAECAMKAHGETCRLTDPSFDPNTQPPEMLWMRIVIFQLYSFCMFLQEPELAYAAARLVLTARVLNTAKNMVFCVVRWSGMFLVRMLSEWRHSEREPEDAGGKGEATADKDTVASPLDAFPQTATPCGGELPTQAARGDAVREEGEDDFLGVSTWVDARNTHATPTARSEGSSDGDDDDLDDTKHYVWDTSIKTYVACKKETMREPCEGALAESVCLDRSADLSAASTLAHSHISQANTSLGVLHFDTGPENLMCLPDEAQVQAGALGKHAGAGDVGGCCMGASAGLDHTREGVDQPHEKLLARILELETRIKHDLAQARDTETVSQSSKAGSHLGGLLGGCGYGVAAVTVAAGVVCMCAASAKLASSRHYVHGVM